MVETELREWLLEADGLKGVPVLLEKRSPVPERLVLLERTGTTVDRADITHVTMAAQCYARTLEGAAELAGKVVDAMLSAAGLPSVSSINCVDLYNFTNHITKEYRYQAIFEICRYGL